MIKKFIKNIGFAMSANLVSLIVSSILILLVPKFIGVRNYGFFQLYLFYTTYISYLSFGITDGVYLRIGGEDYRQLDKKNLVTQYWFLVAINLLFSIGCFLYLYLSQNIDSDREYILIMTCLSGFLVVPRSLLIFILQATNRIKDYSLIVISEKIIYFILVITMIFFKTQNFKLYILSDIIGKIIASVIAIYICKDIVFSKFSDYTSFLRETFLNFSIGIKLFIANLSSMLIVGIVRFFIERKWDIEIFGKVSLAFSLINMVLVFINSVSIVLFPMIKKIGYKEQRKYYGNIRIVLMTILFFVLCIYFPGIKILGYLLPNYAKSFDYLAILFPIIIFEGKTMVLVNTYLKVLRKENIMLKVNIFIVSLSLVLSILISLLFENLNLYLYLVVFLLAIRNLILELYVSHFLNILVLKDIVYEMILTISFIYVNLNFTEIKGFIIFVSIYVVYLCLNINVLKKLVFKLT